jgi:Raf kinase inhibitor-like YbhB/YbcL family protein
MVFILESPAILHEEMIPSAYTCEGQDISPPLNWSGAPDGTKSFVLIVDDPDAPDPAAPKRTWVHWVLFNIPANVRALEEDVQDLPEGTCEGKTDFGRTGYGGPCPPIGTHRYYLKLYALDALLDINGTPTKPELLKAMDGHVLDKATLMGTYKKGQ